MRSASALWIWLWALGLCALGLCALGLCALAGCANGVEPATPRLAVEAEPETASGDLYGAAIDEQVPLTPLSEIAAEPTRFSDQVVRTEGEIARVCQRAGCWMELREGDGPGVRVPMAGHAFMLPRDSAGRRATLQGRVQVQELSPDMAAHLESEGALATASSLAIHATGVVIN